MSARACLRGIVATLLLATVVSQVAQAEPLRLRYAVWAGFGPALLAEEKSLFEKEGIEVELIEMAEHSATFAALAAGQVDAVLGAVPDTPAFSRPGEEPPACVLALDEDNGGSAILATKGIRSISDLEGKWVGFLQGSIGQFYLNALLNRVGLEQADVQVVDLTAEDAVTALLLKEIDAAPWLSRGKAAEHVHVLTDTSEQPGLLVDCLITTASVFDERKAEFEALARAWFAALDYLEAHPGEAMAIMAHHVGAGMDPEAFAEALETLRFYDREGNRAYFGTPKDPGPIYATAQEAIDVYSNLGVLTFDLSPSDIILHGILEE